MGNQRFHYFIRRSHRLLGVIIGIQFIAWTIGGLYFSWSDMDEVHGDYELAHAGMIPIDPAYISPGPVLDSLKRSGQIDSIADMKLISILGRPTWQITYMPVGQTVHGHEAYLLDAFTGIIRQPLSETEAVDVARNQYLGNGEVEKVEYISEINPTHEYREQPLPAFAVTFNDERHTTIYVASKLGVVTKARNRPWRQFDFLWMMHTMDYESRDNITNWLLRGFSIFGLVTVASGFTLFFVSRKRKKRVKGH